MSLPVSKNPIHNLLILLTPDAHQMPSFSDALHLSLRPRQFDALEGCHAKLSQLDPSEIAHARHAIDRFCAVRHAHTERGATRAAHFHFKHDFVVARYDFDVTVRIARMAAVRPRGSAILQMNK